MEDGVGAGEGAREPRSYGLCGVGMCEGMGQQPFGPGEAGEVEKSG